MHPRLDGRLRRHDSLDGLVVLVTGVTAGIGRATALRLTARGAAVVGCARDRGRLDELAAQVPGLVPVPCDLTRRQERARLARFVQNEAGPINVLVNNAGIGM